MIDQQEDNIIMELGEVQLQFARLIWENEPIGSGELVKICAEKFGWKKSTTYTVLKKLCEKGLFQNNNGTVSALMSENEYNMRKSEEFIEDHFGGSLPAFLTAFSAGRKLTEKEIRDIQNIIDNAKNDHCAP